MTWTYMQAAFSLSRPFSLSLSLSLSPSPRGAGARTSSVMAWATWSSIIHFKPFFKERFSCLRVHFVYFPLFFVDEQLCWDSLHARAGWALFSRITPAASVQSPFESLFRRTFTHILNLVVQLLRYSGTSLWLREFALLLLWSSSLYRLVLVSSSVPPIILSVGILAVVLRDWQRFDLWINQWAFLFV